MKRYLSYRILPFTFVFLAFISCNKYLNVVPDDTLTEDDIFQSKTDIDQYLAQIYSNVPDELAQRYTLTSNSGPWNAASDDSKYNWSFPYSDFMNLSTWANTDDEVEDYWSNWYKSIRSATDFINKIDDANTAEMTDALKKQYKGEARGVRALYYFWLLRMYGPVPIIGNDVPAPDADLSTLLLPRQPFDSCISYVVSQLDSAALDLPEIPGVPDGTPAPASNQIEWGRITSGICKAYKAEALLLQASPLFNGNSDMASLKNTDGTQLISQTADVNKWALAAQAAKDFITTYVPTVYDLYMETNADPFKAAYLSCSDVMTQHWNKEWIMARPNSTDYQQYDETPKLVGYPANLAGGGAFGVTQKMVDAYYMKNGRTIDDPESEYQSSGFSNFQAPYDVKERSTYNPWVNREPRFYVGVTYNNSYWISQSGSSTEVIVQMNYSGNSGRSQSSTDVTPTGYIVRKGATYGVSGGQGALLLRLSQIYLDYAEALNESSPGDPDILKYLNLIRQRADVPLYGTGEDEIPAPSGQSEMRTAIRRERQIELAFENTRYFDCRRWKTALKEFAGSFYGMNLNANGDDFYQKTLLETRVFKQRDYLWPIPQSETLKDNLLVQNPGW